MKKNRCVFPLIGGRYTAMFCIYPRGEGEMHGYLAVTGAMKVGFGMDLDTNRPQYLVIYIICFVSFSSYLAISAVFISCILQSQYPPFLCNYSLQ